MNRIILMLLSILSLNTIHEVMTAPARLLIIDTNGYPQTHYHTLLQLSKQVGFVPAYYTYYDSESIDYTLYDTIIIFLNEHSATLSSHTLVAPIREKLFACGTNKNTTIGIVLPAIPDKTDTLIATIRAYSPFLDSLTAQAQHTIEQRIRLFLNAPVRRNTTYETTLYQSRPQQSKALKQLQRLTRQLPTRVSGAVTLPLYQPKNRTIHAVLPFGLLCSNPRTQQRLFISKVPLMTFGEMEEAFTIMPADATLTELLLTSLQQTLYELYRLSTTNKKQKITAPGKMPMPLAPHLTTTYARAIQKAAKQERQQQTLLPGLHTPISCAWMDPAPNDALNEQQARCMAHAIHQARIQLLWVRFNPEEYLLGPEHSIRHAHKEQYLERLQLLSQALKDEYGNDKDALPKICVGLDLTGNFERLPVKNYVQTMYGQHLTALPSPLDTTFFWQRYVVDALKSFVAEWNTNVGNGIPLAGVFIDCEMYHVAPLANNTNTPMQPLLYDATMDIGNTTWHYYISQRGIPDTPTNTTRERVEYLRRYNLFHDYFNVLEQRMIEIGKWLGNEIGQCIPNALVGVYLPTLSDCWVYTGLLKGLQQANKSLMLATLNSRFFTYYPLLHDQGITPYHLRILLLSFLTQSDDFKQIPTINTYHDGVWFNRFSWVCVPHDKTAWWQTESTPLDRQQLADGIAQAFTSTLSRLCLII